MIKHHAFASATIASVGNVPYYIPSALLPTPPESCRLMFGNATNFANGLVPVSLLVIPSGSDVDGATLSSIVTDYFKVDDVFSETFLEHIYLLASYQTKQLTFEDSASSILATWGTQSVHEIVPSINENINYRGGPYFASGKGLSQAWRLYEDTNGAFMFPVVPVDNSSGT